MVGIEINILESKTPNGWSFEVNIEEQGSETNHTVTMSQDFYDTLNTNSSPKELVEKSFNFLLKRESKEQILSNFDITLISRYFPEFEEYLNNL
jgi:hypothetical protein